MDDDVSSTGFEPLFIKEDDAEPNLMEQRECNMAQSGLNFTGTSLNPSVSIKPYLQEMDELLKSCEELTGIPFGSHFSESYTETNMGGTIHLQDKDEVTMGSCRGMSIPPQAYISTSYIDTHVDGDRTEEQPEQPPSQSMGTIINRCGVPPEVSHHTEMPLTSAGNKLSETMMEYEGQLLGMLAMLESCMEDPQEYVHISKNPDVYRGTTLIPIQQERSDKLQAQPMQLQGQSGNHEVLDPRFRFSGPSEPLDGKENDQMCCEGSKTEYMIDKGFEMKGDITETEMSGPYDLKMDTTNFRSGVDEQGELGSKMEKCIEEVHLLQTKRKKLLAEVLELRGNKDREDTEVSNDMEEDTEEGINSKVAELMNILKKEEEARREERKREIQSLKEERAEEERRMWKVNLERQGLQDELRKLKRKLFAVARDCAHSQAAFNTQHREVELLKREEEELQSLVLQLTEEGCQLRSTQQQLLLDLQAQLHVHRSSQMSNTQEELTECRRHSCGDIQQYLQGGLRALEERYEPMLLALLKRREATAGALVKAKDQAQELKAQLGPLKEVIQKLTLQRACLEEKLKLLHIQWKEEVGHYKETVNCLEESSRELKTELNIQKKKTKEAEELRDSLIKQCLLYRAATEDHKCDHEKKT